MATATAPPIRTAPQPAGDYLLGGIFMMLIINAVQRVVGLARSLGFCHFLSEQQLGEWALANSFFMIGVPVALLGLPGSFSKYVTYYRNRQQLGDYLLNVLSVSGLGLLAMTLWIVCFPNSFSQLIFKQENPLTITLWCAATLVSLLIFSIVYEIIGSLRHVRAMAIMQFLQSVVFAALGLPMIAQSGSWAALLPCYTIACAVATLPGIWILQRLYRHELRPSGHMDRGSMWAKIIPYAAALWAMNLLGNLFEVSDRYMLLHLIAGGAERGQAAVGQYHCGRILPNLLTSVAMMLGGVLLPYLSADWEAGRRTQIAARMRQMLQATSLGFMSVSVLSLLLAPWLFHYGFGGRFAQAQAILPLALLQAVWASLFSISQAYMLCAERGKELALLLVAGLSVNLALNWSCIQAFGLPGAVAATATAGLLMLLLLLWRMSRNGCSLSPGTIALCTLPLCILLGPVVLTLVLALVVVIGGRTNWLMSEEDRQQIDAFMLPKLEKLGLPLSTLWP
ncbi:MAG: oligosaccharide flippase family protein [Planctomycetales bacterium]|nr:oligosaccharide flippase family protein [Planctomycetales bacterium]